MESPLKQHRIARNITLKEAADRLGIKPSVLHKWENKRVPAERCVDVSAATGIPCQVLRPDVFKGDAA